MKNIDDMYDSRDSVALAVAPTEDEIIAFVSTHYGFGQEAKEALKSFKELDLLAIGRWIAISDGLGIILTDDEKKDAELNFNAYQALREKAWREGRYKEKYQNYKEDYEG